MRAHTQTRTYAHTHAHIHTCTRLHACAPGLNPRAAPLSCLQEQLRLGYACTAVRDLLDEMDLTHPTLLPLRQRLDELLRTKQERVASRRGTQWMHVLGASHVGVPCARARSRGMHAGEPATWVCGCVCVCAHARSRGMHACGRVRVVRRWAGCLRHQLRRLSQGVDHACVHTWLHVCTLLKDRACGCMRACVCALVQCPRSHKGVACNHKKGFAMITL